MLSPVFDSGPKRKGQRGRFNFEIPEAGIVICLQTQFKAINSYIYIS